MEWSERYATGIERIDKQHKMLFAMTHDFAMALDEGRGERTYHILLESLDAYARAHFNFEEGCMYKHQCPAADANQRAHLGFVEYLTKCRQQYANLGFDPAAARDLMETLQRWLADHIGRIDLQLREVT